MKQNNTTTAEEYLQAFSRGEEKGFTFYFKTFYPALCLFANKYIKDKQAAEDVVSESFLKTWSKHEIFTSSAGLKSYLYRSVYHASLNYLGRTQKTIGLDSTPFSVEPAEYNNFVENTVRAEMLRELEKAMNMLPTRCKKIFTKLYVEGKTVKQTAKELTLSVNTIKSQKARGFVLLRAKLLPFLIFQALFAFLFS